ncbi:MAG: CcdB family protein [Spirochaeta sp.]|jgi:toxin CcdB|nr:CcdB family protein [Spirochaeta sp.]
MAQFDIYLNEDKSTQTRFPYLLDIQVDLLSDLPTRLVVPLRRGTGAEPWVVSRLHPVLELGDTSVVAVFSEMAAVSSNVLGNRLGDARRQRTELIAAVDLMVTGF